LAENERGLTGERIPTPMDGQRLIEADDGRCVSSTNA
jgi:hypothetical protein